MGEAARYTRYFCPAFLDLVTMAAEAQQAVVTWLSTTSDFLWHLPGMCLWSDLKGCRMRSGHACGARASPEHPESRRHLAGCSAER